MPSEQSADDVARAIKKTMTVLRELAESILEQLADLEAAAAAMAESSSTARNQVNDAARRHTLDCGIKLGWAVKAVAMYRDALNSPHSDGRQS